jgi:large repetitive protein
MARSRARRAASLGTAVALAAGLVVQACSREVVLVDIGTVTVSPSEAQMLVGNTLQFSAIVVDDRGRTIPGCDVEWSSGSPQVVSISSTGLATALQQGQATIRAECLGVSGEATVTVIGAAPAIGVSPSSLSFNGTPGGASPPPKTVTVTNAGDGRLTGLAVQVQYSPSGVDWLTATLAGTEATTTLTVTPTSETSGLPVGEYTATIRLTSPVASNSPVLIPVTLSISSISVVESGDSTVVDEAGTLTDDFTVALDLEPTSNVVLLLTSADPGEVTVDRASLTFTPENWADPQTVTVTGHDDLINDGDQVIPVTIAVDDANSDDAFASVPDVSLPVTVRDNGAGLIVIESGGDSEVSEAGTQDSFTVMLNGEPASNVVLTVTSLDVSEVTASPATLTFTPANWALAQTVTLTGVDDPFVDGNQITQVIVSVNAALSDDAYDAVADVTVEVTTTDDDGAGFTVTESGGTTEVTEAAGDRHTDSLSVVLTSQPASNVVLTVVSSNPAQATVDKATLTFTPANWSTPQIVTVTAVDDDVDDGNVVVQVTISVDDANSDDTYDLVPDKVIDVTTIDDEGAQFVLTAGALTVAESGGSPATFTVVLSTQPVSSVRLTVTANDPGEVNVLTPEVTFLQSDWSTAKTISLLGVDDDVVDGDQLTMVTVAVDTLNSDPAYRSVDDQSVPVTTTDNEVAGFTVSHTGGGTTVTEAGATDAMTVVLTARPVADVVFNVSSGDLSEATVAPAQVTFTNADWNVPKSVTVTGVDDDEDDGDQVTQITFAINAALSENNWDGLASQMLPVTTQDDDDAGITVTPTSGLVTTEAGGTAQFTVVLASQPTANVTIALSSSDTSEGTVTPTSLTFTPLGPTATRWSTPHVVTITGVDDAVDDGDVNYTIVTNPATSSDPKYNGVNPPNVSVTNTDDDTAMVTLSVNKTSLAEDGSQNPATVTATLSVPSTQQVTVNLGFTGTATLTSDYTRSGTQIVIPAGSTSGSVTINAVQDGTDEPNETVIVDITSVTNATESGTQQVTVTIIDDDDVTVTLGVDKTSLAEDGSQNPATVTATLSGPSTQQVTVNLGFTGTATLTSDYTRSGTQIVIPAGSTSGSVTINAVQDGTDEPNETVIVDITGVTNATESGTQQVTVTIVDDDDVTVTLGVDKTSLAEDGSQNPATVTATLSGPSTQQVTVEPRLHRDGDADE